MRKFAAILGGLLCAMLFAAQARGDAGSSAPGDEGAMDAAKAYVKLIQAGDSHQAIGQTWDFQTLMSIIFRDDLAKYSPEDRKVMGSLLQQVVEQLMAHPQIREAMRTAKFDGFEQKQMSESLVAVRFTATFSNGKSARNTLIFNRQQDGWRIVNASVNGQTLMGAQLHDEYLKTGVKPMEYVRGLAKSMAMAMNK